MPFVKIKGMPGKLYVPEIDPSRIKKYPCPDCFSCDGCSDDRCRVCRKEKNTSKKNK